MRWAAGARVGHEGPWPFALVDTPEEEVAAGPLGGKTPQQPSGRPVPGENLEAVATDQGAAIRGKRQVIHLARVRVEGTQVLAGDSVTQHDHVTFALPGDHLAVG